MTLFDFQHTEQDGFHQYATSGQVALDAIWPGLWEMRYPHDRMLNPYLRFGINNGDGERLAVWRALSWAVMVGLDRYAIPNYYGDDAATALDLDLRTVEHVDWDYDIDVAEPDAAFEQADRGFVKARHVVPLRPKPTEWECATSAKARLIPLIRLDQLLLLGPVVSEATSHITLFGLSAVDRLPPLLTVLRSRLRPKVAKVLDIADVIVETAIDHDGLGKSYLVVRSRAEIGDFEAIVNGFERRFKEYSDRSARMTSFEEFILAIEKLLDARTEPSAATSPSPERLDT